MPDLVCVEVLDTLGGFARLARNTPTLDGSIPLRAAQACLPFLDGNRLGLQVVLDTKLSVEKSLSGYRLHAPPESLVRALSGAAPRLAAEGLLPEGSWLAKKLAKGLVWRADRSGALALFTGLFLRPKPGFVLRVSHAGNRKNVLFGVRERFIVDASAPCPLVLELEPGKDARFPLLLGGELASLFPLVPRVECRHADLSPESEAARAHLAFFDPKYFERKKRGPTKKYKRAVSGAEVASPASSGRVELVEAGPGGIGEITRFPVASAAGVSEREIPGLVALEIRNGVPLRARFDGHVADVVPDERRLALYRERTEAAWSAAFDTDTLMSHRGAVWYFSKYVTPHQAGEPLFFVKPSVLTRTTAGWSTLVDGALGSGFEVLRGAVATDRLHALPAVIRLLHPGQRVLLPEDLPLARCFPFPRSTFDATADRIPWSLPGSRT